MPQIKYADGIEVPKYLRDGFTITMWVRFMDKVNSGTLFNFGNPTRENNPHGFLLETYVLHEDEFDSPGNREDGQPFFMDEDSERFVRLVVREADGSIRDSHVGTSWFDKQNTSWRMDVAGTPGLDYIPDFGNSYEDGLFAQTRIPIDFDEWYFIVASYNPNVNEQSSYGSTYDVGSTITDYWKNNIHHSDGSYVSYSGFGNRCKVEVISKSQLLRARGYKPQED